MERVEAGGKNAIWTKNNEKKYSFNTKLYMLDLFEFLPYIDVFHYAKLSSYKRVK